MEHISRIFSALDLVFGAALSAFLGVSLASREMGKSDLVLLALGLISISISIINSQTDIIGLLSNAVPWKSFTISIVGFGSAGFWFSYLTDQPAVIWVILGVWGIMYFSIFAIRKAVRA
ncbi:hypothetical protein K3175_07750 [Qipengyuania sp. GH1]|uniref:hypothetical protein n=1 Tax=Qipengyuania aestuarii TaxID=2867241 RepID=UPI001C86A1B8|nr:hypothetical protein [Qipengyuania aestuarii]MBX7535551.1 hypothetical protein [Qipengyuania aestuarii]